MPGEGPWGRRSSMGMNGLLRTGNRENQTQEPGLERPGRRRGDRPSRTVAKGGCLDPTARSWRARLGSSAHSGAGGPAGTSTPWPGTPWSGHHAGPPGESPPGSPAANTPRRHGTQPGPGFPPRKGQDAARCLDPSPSPATARTRPARGGGEDAGLRPRTALGSRQLTIRPRHQRNRSTSGRWTNLPPPRPPDPRPPFSL